MTLRHAPLSSAGSSLIFALLGVGLAACGSEFSRGDANGGDVGGSGDGDAGDATTGSPDPVTGLPGRPDGGGDDASDGAASVADARAECAPSATAACTEDDRGQPIPGLSDPARGICKIGVKTCSPAGTWGPCAGAVGPKARDCESTADNDCDGKPDDTIDAVCECNAAHPSRPITGGPKNCQCTEACGTDHRWVVCTPPDACDCSPTATQACTGASGCAGGKQTCASDRTWGACLGAPDKATYCIDHDGDTFCAATTACSTVCPGALGAEWKTSCPTTDCDDNNASVNPNAKPSCKPTNECHGGALSCSATGNTCADTGTAVANRTACTGGVCNAGVCAACVTGDARCASNTPQSCNAQGQWVNGAACASVATCSVAGTTASCACPAGYTGNGVTCTPTPILMCAAAANIKSPIALAGGQAYFTTDDYTKADSSVAQDLSTCSLSKVGATAAVVSSTGFLQSYPAIGSYPAGNEVYSSLYQAPNALIRKSTRLTRYLAPSNVATSISWASASDGTLVQSGDCREFAVDASGGYLFCKVAGGVLATLLPSSLPSTITPDPCISSTDSLDLIAAGAGHVAVLDTTTGTIVGASAPGCQTKVSVATGITKAYSLATDGSQVFFSDGASVYACPFSGCPSSLTAAALAANQGIVTGIAFDDTNVYWVGQAGLVSCAKTGCGGAPKVRAAGVTPTVGISVDGTALYYSQGSAVYRLVKN